MMFAKQNGFLFFAFLFLGCWLIGTMAIRAADADFYVGTYTDTGSKGIYRFVLNRETGALTDKGLVVEASNPSFLAIASGGRFLYAVDQKAQGSVSAYAIGDEGRLSLLNQQPSGGDGPCYLSVDPTGKNVLVANYNSGNVEVLPIQADGQLGKSTDFVQFTGSGLFPARQKSSHAHSINVQGKNAYACDLGSDQVFLFHFDPVKGVLTPQKTPTIVVQPGSGPRHMAISSGYIFVVNELLNTISTFKQVERNGMLVPQQTLSTLPEDFKGTNTAAEIAVHPSGKYLYASNRGHNSIARFAIGESGQLTPMGFTSTRGKQPRNFVIESSGRWLIVANQESNQLVVFRIDAVTGNLTPVGAPVEVYSPTCVAELL